jgi:argininosuccinate synthase
MMRMHLNGSMYLDWLQLMEKKIDTFAANKAGQPETDATFARSKAQFATMKAQAARIQSVDAEVHVDHDGIVTTTQTTLK